MFPILCGGTGAVETGSHSVALSVFGTRLASTQEFCLPTAEIMRMPLGLVLCFPVWKCTWFILSNLLRMTCVCYNVCAGRCMCPMHLWRSEGSIVKSGFSFHFMDPVSKGGSQTLWQALFCPLYSPPCSIYSSLTA